MKPFRPARFGALLGSAILFAAVHLSSSPVQAQPSTPPEVKLSEKLEKRAVNIWSEGTRISGDLFYPKGLKEGEKLPAILLTHGWGGVRAHLNQGYAPKFAAGGFVVLTIDYRGWGDSDSKLVMTEPMPKPDEKGMVTVTARAIREVVDPFDQVEDITHALDFLEGEPIVDKTRIGLWGTSYSGGHSVYVAAQDDRVKCIVSQVGAQDSRDGVAKIFVAKGGLDYAHDKAIRIARGEDPPVPQGVDIAPNLKGTPHISKMMFYRPVEAAGRIKVPALIIDAEKEELFSNADHGKKVALILEQGNKAPVKYVVVPGITHYGIYTTAFKQGSDMALAWFTEYLKPAKQN